MNDKSCATSCNSCGSHAGFYICMALLAIAIAGSGYWWFTINNEDAAKETTAQMNQPSHPRPRPAAAPSPSASVPSSDGR